VGVTHHRALWSPDFPPADGCPPDGDHPVRFSQSKQFIPTTADDFLPIPRKTTSLTVSKP